MASANFTNLSLHIANADIDFGAGTFKAMLMDDGITPTETELDTWVTRADVDAAAREHAVSGNYVAGGFDCTVTVNATDTTNNLTAITIEPAVGNGNAVFSNASISSVGIIIYFSTGAAASDLLISFVDFNGTITSTNGDFNVTFDNDLEISV